MQHGEGLARRITMELPSEEINQEVEQRLKKLARTVRMNGFRPGKVPYKIVHERYASQIQNEVFNEQIENTIHAIIEQEQLHLVNAPTIDKNINQSEGQIHYHFTAEFEVFPDITLASLESYTIYRPLAEVTDKDVEDMLNSFREQKQTWSVVKRHARLGDKVTISMQFFGADKLVKQIEKVSVTLGDGLSLQELESALIGVMTGETKAIQLPLLNNKENIYNIMTLCNVTIQEIAEPVLPEINEEFVRSYGIESGDVNYLRKDIRKNMESSLVEYVRNNIKWQIMNVLIKAHSIPLPKVLIEWEKEILKADVTKEGQHNIPATWLEEQAKNRVALRLIIGEIMRKHSIVLDAARVQNTIQTIAISYEDPESVFKYYRDPEKLKAIEHLVLEDQTVDWILTQVQIKNEPSTFQKITKFNLNNIEGKGIFLTGYPNN